MTRVKWKIPITVFSNNYAIDSKADMRVPRHGTNHQAMAHDNKYCV